MSRLPLVAVDQLPAAASDFVSRRGTLNVFRVLAHAPDVFAGWTQMVDELLDSPTFTLRTRELVIFRVARLQDSRYELGRHIGLARDAGLTDPQISAIVETEDFEAAGFTDDERVVLGVVTELCTTRRLGDESFTAARRIFGDERFTELLMLVSCYYGLALVLNAADIDLDTDSRFRP